MIIFTESLIHIMSDWLSSLSRPIDVVKFHGYTFHTVLYTFDLNLEILNVNWEEKMKNTRHKKVAGKRGKYFNKYVIGEGDMEYLLKKDQDLIKTLHINEEFKEALNLGLEHMCIKREWTPARKHLEKALEHKPNDIPTELLLKHLRDHGHTCPDNFQGYREEE